VGLSQALQQERGLGGNEDGLQIASEAEAPSRQNIEVIANGDVEIFSISSQPAI
jgi:hypothetical protein